MTNTEYNLTAEDALKKWPEGVFVTAVPEHKPLKIKHFVGGLFPFYWGDGAWMPITKATRLLPPDELYRLIPYDSLEYIMRFEGPEHPVNNAKALLEAGHVLRVPIRGEDWRLTHGVLYFKNSRYSDWCKSNGNGIEDTVMDAIGGELVLLKGFEDLGPYQEAPAPEPSKRYLENLEQLKWVKTVQFVCPINGVEFRRTKHYREQKWVMQDIIELSVALCEGWPVEILEGEEPSE